MASNASHSDLPTGDNPIASLYRSLSDECSRTLERSLEPGRLERLARSHLFASELEMWIKCLDARPESQLLRVSVQEYQFALLAMAQGHYRSAFKGLRLVMELALQAVLLSAHPIELREWFNGERDTSWAAIRDESSGVFSIRFARAFFPELQAHVAQHRQLAIVHYRACSEHVHGSMAMAGFVPSHIEFDSGSFDSWHSKAEGAALVVHFALALRYLTELDGAQRQSLDPILMEWLGQIAAVRRTFGHEGGD